RVRAWVYPPWFDSVTIITRSGQKDTPCPTLFPAKLHTNKDTTLPALDLDELLALRVSYETRKRQAGGHDVPWPAL
ncbi:MAG: hypothetical protein ABIL25_06575, partial [candidate division WOR-3 bacterium]